MPHPRLLARLPRHTLTKPPPLRPIRHYSATPPSPSPPPPSSSSSSSALDPRTELECALLDLQRHVPTYTNLPRLQLALQGLRQPPGAETLRIAILSTDGSASIGREVVRLLLADPLKDTEDWEAALTGDGTAPLIVRVRGVEDGVERENELVAREGVLEVAKPSLLEEIQVNTPILQGRRVELLVMDANFPQQTEAIASHFEDTLLVPMVDIASSEGRYFPIRTPVHGAILVGRGLLGVAKIIGLPVPGIGDVVTAAVDLPEYTAAEQDPGLPINLIDVNTAARAISLIRQGPQHAIEYERLWHSSKLSTVTDWLNSIVRTPSGATNPALRQLILSVLEHTQSCITADEAQQAAQYPRLRAASLPGWAPEVLAGVLEEWAQKAHSELQDGLDRAFTGRGWRMLRWWKLFWRVDDVGSLTAQLMAASFLPQAERELIYLAGRIRQTREEEPAYQQPSSPRRTEAPASGKGAQQSSTKAVSTEPSTPVKPAPKPSPSLPVGSQWPQHISFTRNCLYTSTIPSLQALAQKLVFQTYSTSALMTSLAALVYTSSSLYEAGAVAALGIVWSLRRMQRKWDAAREFWEGEVREEGRKSLRAAERSVGDVLQVKIEKRDAKETALGVEQRQKARQLVETARAALGRMR